MTAPALDAAGHKTLADTSSVSDHVIDVPSNSVGDAVYIAIVCDGNQSFTFPAGFTVIHSNISISSTATFGLGRKEIAGSADSGTYTVTTSGSERAAAIAWRQSGDTGVDHAPTPNTGSGATATCPSATTTGADRLILLIVATDGDSTTHSTVSGFTKLNEIFAFSGGTISVQYATQAAAGATGTNDVAISSEQWSAVTVAVAGTAGGGEEAGPLVNGWRLKSKIGGAIVA